MIRELGHLEGGVVTPRILKPLPYFFSPGKMSALRETSPAAAYPSADRCFVLSTRRGAMEALLAPQYNTRQSANDRPLVQTPFSERAAVFSPDGRWIAYVSFETGKDEIYVRPFSGASGKWQVSTDGGVQPAWAHDGRELFYRNGDKMMAVPIESETTFHAGKPERLFEEPFAAPADSNAQYDVAPDDLHFVMIQGSEGDRLRSTQINIVMNWPRELKRLVPTDN